MACLPGVQLETGVEFAVDGPPDVPVTTCVAVIAPDADGVAADTASVGVIAAVVSVAAIVGAAAVVSVGTTAMVVSVGAVPGAFTIVVGVAAGPQPAMSIVKNRKAATIAARPLSMLPNMLTFLL